MLKELILQYLRERHATYATPVRSEELAKAFRICTTYAREQAGALAREGLVGVRAGRGGGYYLPEERGDGAGPAGESAVYAVPSRIGRLDGYLAELEAAAARLIDEVDTLALERPQVKQISSQLRRRLEALSMARRTLRDTLNST